MDFEKVLAVRNTKTIYKDGDTVIKVFNENFKKSDILNEALNQARVEETGLKMPKVLEVKKIEGKWAIVSEFIKGKTLSELMEKEPKKADEYLTKFVDIQLEIQSKKAPLLNKLKDKMQAKISATDFDATTRYELHTRIASMPKHNKVCHGDFNPSNVIITDNGEAYVIDWAHATQGNASADAARTYLLFMLEGKKDIAEKYLDLFCEKSDTARQYVQQWMPVVAASQSTKGNSEEKEFLASWVNVVQYE